MVNQNAEAVGNNKEFLELLAHQNKQILSALASQNKMLTKIQGRRSAGRGGLPDEVSDDDTDVMTANKRGSVKFNYPSDTEMETKEPTGPMTFGPWGFNDSPASFQLRQRVLRNELTPAELVQSKDALFGNVQCEDQLTGDSFGKNWKRMRNLDGHGKPIAPKWSKEGAPSVRSLIPTIELGGKAAIQVNTGTYYLTVQYNNEEDMWGVESAIVIGEVSFDNRGHVLARGTDFEKLAKNKPGVNEKPDKWYSMKVSSSPWNDGDKLRFKIDTNANTISYHNATTGSKKVLKNVLSYTNKGNKPIKVFAYCGAKVLPEFPSSSADSNRLSIIASKLAW